MSLILRQMSPLLQQLGIYEMPAHERLALAQEIIASVIAEDAPVPLTEAQLQEIERRVADHEAHPEDAIPGEIVHREIRARLAARRS
jgi:putative addiction module component (TIGR02574 family)